jgi:uncharacterized membrane protein
MRDWTRGEKIGCWSMLVGTVTCLAVLATVPPFRGLLLRFFPESESPRSRETGQAESQEVLEQQKKLLEEQTLALREEARRLYEERIASRRERLESIAERYRKGGRREYDRILLHNKCSQLVAVSLYYLDLDEKWITRGWWEVAPGGTMTTDAMTRNQYVYFFAENQRAGLLWDGTGKEDSLSLSVSDSKFDHLQGERFLYQKPRSASFYRRDTGSSWTDHTEVFECPAEAPQ